MSNWIDLKKTNKKTLIYVSLIISLHLILWFIFTLFTTSWYSFYPEFEPLTYLDTIKRVFVLFFNYPGIYTTFWLYYVTMPLYTFITIAIISIGLFLSLRNTLHNNLAIRFLYLLVILIFLIVSYLIAGVETRYSFFIYPVVLLLVVISIYLISELIFRQKNYRNIFTLISLIFFMFFTEDYDYSHAFNIDEPEYNFRENYNDMLKRHFYRRYDIRTPAEYVNKNINPNEIVIVNEMVLEYYLKKVDYIFIEYKSRRFPILSTKNGKKERWTNSDLIYEKKSLVEMLNNSKKTIWFVVHKLPYIQKPLLEIEFYEKFEKVIFLF